MKLNQEIIQLFDEYTHKPLTRVEFLSRLTKLIGGTAALSTILPALEGSYAASAQVAEDDSDLLISTAEFSSPNGIIKGYLAQPKQAKKRLGAVLVIHENRGLTPHIKDVTRRIAKEGFIALGIDGLSQFGGTPINEDEGRTLIGKLDAKQNMENMLSGLSYLRTLKNSNQKTACIGFCWGGGVVNDLAAADPALTLGVPYYGRQIDATLVPKIKAKLMLHYAGLDERINAGIPAYENALKSNQIDYQLFIYEGAQHAFNNDSSPARYQKEPADLAWSRTLNFFKKHLKEQ
jgi:carboxymethylenebutenolidase